MSAEPGDHVICRDFRLDKPLEPHSDIEPISLNTTIEKVNIENIENKEDKEKEPKKKRTTKTIKRKREEEEEKDDSPPQKIRVLGIDPGAKRFAWSVVEGMEKCVTSATTIKAEEVVDLLTDGQYEPLLGKKVFELFRDPKRHPFIIDPLVDVYTIEKQASTFHDKEGNANMHKLAGALATAIYYETQDEEYKRKRREMKKEEHPDDPIIHCPSAINLKQLYSPITYDLTDTYQKEAWIESKNVTKVGMDSNQSRAVNKMNNKKAVKKMVGKSRVADEKEYFREVGPDGQKDLSDARLHALWVIHVGKAKFQKDAEKTKEREIHDKKHLIGTPTCPKFYPLAMQDLRRARQQAIFNIHHTQ